MKSERPWAALVRTFPMLCTRCAALVGCWMIHHRTNATAAHVRTVLSFTAASLGAQTSPFCQYPFILARTRPGCGSKPARSSPCSVPNGCSMPGTSRQYARNLAALRMSIVESMPPRGSMQPTAADRKQPRRRTRTDLLASPFRFLDVPRSDNLPLCRACLGHGDA